MPHYHLHLHNAHTDVSDEEGHELDDMAAAIDMALAGIRDFIAHEAMTGKLDFRGHLDIADDTGMILKSIPFREAFEFKGL